MHLPEEIARFAKAGRKNEVLKRCKSWMPLLAKVEVFKVDVM